MKKYKLLIHEKACWGCKTCEVACRQENHHNGSPRLIYVSEEGPHMDDTGQNFIFRVNLCRHCDDPPCADSCPDEAISIRSDGLVILDDDKCTGCRACIKACPFDAVGFDSVRGIAGKCNLCHHRIEKGLLPACADNVCLARCIEFTVYE